MVEKAEREGQGRGLETRTWSVMVKKEKSLWVCVPPQFNVQLKRTKFWSDTDL